MTTTEAVLFYAAKLFQARTDLALHFPLGEEASAGWIDRAERVAQLEAGFLALETTLLAEVAAQE